MKPEKMTLREAFEKWLDEGTPERTPEGDYKSAIVTSDWMVWSAGARHVMDRYAPLLAVAERLCESSAYWGEYDVPLGIVEELNAAIEAAKEPG